MGYGCGLCCSLRVGDEMGIEEAIWKIPRFKTTVTSAGDVYQQVMYLQKLQLICRGVSD